MLWFTAAQTAKQNGNNYANSKTMVRAAWTPVVPAMPAYSGVPAVIT